MYWGQVVYIRTPLPEGAYTVVITQGGKELARGPFVIRNLVVMTPDRIICKNLRTRKKVVIHKPTGLERTHQDIGDCVDNGLKVRERDKIERIYKGSVTAIIYRGGE